MLRVSGKSRDAVSAVFAFNVVVVRIVLVRDPGLETDTFQDRQGRVSWKSLVGERAPAPIERGSRRAHDIDMTTVGAKADAWIRLRPRHDRQDAIYRIRVSSLRKIERPGCGSRAAKRTSSAVRMPGSKYSVLKMLLTINCALKPGRKSR